MTSIAGQRTVITVDGLAATGKSTISKLLAHEINYIPFSSGEIYRAFAFGYRCKYQEFETKNVLDYAQECDIQMPATGELIVDGMKLTEQERDSLSEYSELTSKVAVFPQVREKLKPLQINAYYPSNIVAEGRDQGFVFHDAFLKFFITATPEVREIRRRGKMDSAALAKELAERDKRDSERTVAPTIPAPGAITIENNGNDPRVPVEKMKQIIMEAVRRHKETIL